MTLRDYQQKAVDYAEDELKVRDRVLLASPTGTGKSYIINALKTSPSHYVTSPKVEILESLLEKCGLTGNAEDYNYYTPIRLRNLLARGEVPHPSRLIVDEPHHSTADSYQELFALSNCSKLVGLTATPYRGTPRGTKALLDFWGEPQWIMSYAQAFSRGIISCPSFSIVPLVDDDTIKVVNGEFQVTAANEKFSSVLSGIVDLCQKYALPRWDRPTVISVPSVESAKVLKTALDYAGITSEVIVSDTKDRGRLFDGCIACDFALIQINVISEGIDLPLRRLIDLRPTMSPVFWVQMLGRIERLVSPGEKPPEYICTNRNLLRHSYVLDGVVPASVVRDAVAQFGGTLGKSCGARCLGFESLGKFKATEFPLADGSLGLMYAVSRVEGERVTEYVAITTPQHSDVIYAKRERKKGAYGVKWVECSAPEIDVGYASIPPSPLSDKQVAWWKRSAATRGLDAEAEINNRQFQVLPVLFDIKRRL